MGPSTVVDLLGGVQIGGGLELLSEAEVGRQFVTNLSVWDS